jgi:hypothetical protein
MQIRMQHLRLTFGPRHEPALRPLGCSADARNDSVNFCAGFAPQLAPEKNEIKKILHVSPNFRHLTRLESVNSLRNLSNGCTKLRRIYANKTFGINENRRQNSQVE